MISGVDLYCKQSRGNGRRISGMRVSSGRVVCACWGGVRKERRGRGGVGGLCYL